MSNKLLDKVRSSGSMDATVAAAKVLRAGGDDIIAGAAKDAKNLRLDQIEPDPDQPRVEFDGKAMAILVKDIQKRGVLQPILVSPPATEDGKYLIIAGERRWRASIQAGKNRIPCLVRDMNETDRRSAQLVENIIRENLSDVEKGKALRSLYGLRKQENHKITWEDVAVEVGLTRGRINELYNLSELPDAITSLIQAGRLSGSHGISLYRAIDKLGEEAVVELAQDAARAEEGRPGTYRISVAKLRSEIANRISPPAPSVQVVHAIQADEKSSHQSEVPDTSYASEHNEDTSFIDRTLEALKAGSVSAQHREQLLRMLNGVE